MGETRRPIASNSSDRVATDVFTRPILRVVVDSIAPPIAGLAFLGLAAFLLTQAGGNLGLLMPVALMGFFGVLLLSALPTIMRRGLRRQVIAVGPDGIDHVDAGLLPWLDIAEVRVEHNIGGAGRRAVMAYDRLGIVPRDTAVADAIAGGLTRGLIGWFARVANDKARSSGATVRMTEIEAMAPIGVAAYELEQPFGELVASIGRFAPVLERAGATATGSAIASGPVLPAAEDPVQPA